MRCKQCRQKMNKVNSVRNPRRAELRVCPNCFKSSQATKPSRGAGLLARTIMQETPTMRVKVHPVEPRGFIAYIPDQDTKWELGYSIPEAVGKLVLRFPVETGIQDPSAQLPKGGEREDRELPQTEEENHGKRTDTV